MPTKLQHYVPQFYLEGFADPERPTNVWVYEKGSGKPRSQGIKGTAAETHYYSLNQAGGVKDDTLEREVLSRVETKAAPILLKWRTERRPTISKEDVCAVTPFLATCWVRSPRMRGDVEQWWTAIAKVIIQEGLEDDRLIDDFLKAHPESRDSKDELREALRVAQDPTRISIKPNKNLLVGQSFLMTDDIVPYLIRRNWAILEAPSDIDLVTSDSPLSVFELTSRGRALIGVGIGNPGAELTLSISPRRALRLALRERKLWRRIGRSEATEINRRIVCQAERYVYASRKSKKIHEVVQEFASTIGRPRIDPSFARNLSKKVQERIRRSNSDDPD